MKYFAAAEIDRIQDIILASDKFKEMIGASCLIDGATTHVTAIVNDNPSVNLLWSVSGVYKLGGDDLKELADVLWQIRQKLVDEQGLSATFEIIEAKPVDSVTGIFKQLDDGIRRQKDSRHGEDGSPSCPYFVPCRILPGEYANYWQPDWDKNDRLHRRALASEKARIRKGQEDKNRGLPFVRKVLQDGVLTLPEDFDDLTVKGANDSYIAFIKGDGDGLGLLLSKLDWDNELWEKSGCKLEAVKRPIEFSSRIQAIFVKALQKAIEETVTVPHDGKSGAFPVIPILLGGEDLWVLARRDLALPLTHRIGKYFSEEANNDEFLKIAFQISGVKKITLSFGVLFAQKGYPFDQQTRLVDDLLKNAKKFRKALPEIDQEGCVDFHWLDITGRETLEQMRRKMNAYKDNDKDFHLFSRPWTLSELDAFWTALPPFDKISRRKLFQWRDILRSGDEISVARGHRWLASLEAPEREAWQKGVSGLPARLQPGTLVIKNENDLNQGFWKKDNDVYMSAVQDILELMEIRNCPENIT